VPSIVERFEELLVLGFLQRLAVETNHLSP